MKELMECVSQWLAQGIDVMMVTAVVKSGSVPRGDRTRMALKNGGGFVGTIGGGAVDSKIRQMGFEALKNKSRLKTFILSVKEKEELRMICGSDVTINFQYISAQDEKARQMFSAGSEMFAENMDSWIVTDTTDTVDFSISILTENETFGCPLPDGLSKQVRKVKFETQIEHAGNLYYIEPLTRAEKVYIFGGGHVSQELVSLLSHLKFNCVVFENNSQFANKEIFPTADEIVLGDFDDISKSVNITQKDYVVVLTRAHTFDLAVEAQAIKLEPKYVGVIGSKTKREGVVKKLLELGVPQEGIDRVYNPIGIVKADTPDETAVSIAAELIMVRSGQPIFLKSNFTVG